MFLEKRKRKGGRVNMNREDMLEEMEWILHTIQVDKQKITSYYQNQLEEIYAGVREIYCEFAEPTVGREKRSA